MTKTIEIRLSNYCIEKATARLAHQRDAVRRLPRDVAPRLASVARQTLATMERRLAKLLVDHQSLLEEQSQADSLPSLQ